jgi:hypothetical protein
MKTMGIVPIMNNRKSSYWVEGELGIRNMFQMKITNSLVESVKIEELEAAKIAISHWDEHASGFVETMSTEAYDFLKIHPYQTQWVNTTTWQGLDRTFVENAPLLKAAKAYPQHFDILADLWEYSPDDFVKVLSTGRILVEAIARATYETPMRRKMAKPQGSLEMVAKISASEWCFPEYENTDTMDNGTIASEAAIASTCLPRDWIPRSYEEAKSLVTVDDIATTIGRSACGLLDISRLMNSKGCWSAFLKRTRTAAGTEDAREAAKDVTDMARAFAEQILGPAFELWGASQSHILKALAEETCVTPRIAALMILNGKSLPSVLKASKEWHERRAEMQATMATRLPIERNEWTKGIPDWTNGTLSIIVLGTGKELDDEGANSVDDNGMKGLNHCVGGYAAGCERNSYRIVSVRETGNDGKTRRISTAQIRTTNRPFSVDQHRAVNNGCPPPLARESLARYVNDLNDGTLKVDEVALVEKNRYEMKMKRLAGYDCDLPGAFETAVRSWSRFLPRTARSWGPKEFAERALSLRNA